MAVLRRPSHFTALVCLLLLGIPVFVLNIWVMQKGSLAKVFHRDTLIAIGIHAAWVLVTVRWILGARWLGLISAVALSIGMVGANVYFLLTTKNYALAFYALFLLIMAALYCLHVFRNLREPYYHPGRRWFEGRPAFLPRIEAQLRSGSQGFSVRLSRLGTEGCFAYSAGAKRPVPDTRGTMELKLGDLTLETAVELVTRTRDGAGHGFRFVAGTPDQQKDIRDFIDRVRSSGYVS